MKAIVITIMLQVAIAAALIASTSQPTNLPIGPARLSQASQTVPTAAPSDSVASDQEVRRKSFVLAAITPPPTPTPTPTPCPCPPTPPFPDTAGLVACGDGCTSQPCSWPGDDGTSDIEDCIEDHENQHINDPTVFCNNGWGSYNDSDSSAAECRGYTAECNCMNNAVSGDTEGTDESDDNIDRRDFVCQQAQDYCSSVGQPTPGPTTTPIPSLP